MNKLEKISLGVYRGEFSNVPSRSGHADITLVMTRCGYGCGSLLSNGFDTSGNICTLIYAHHEDTGLYVETADKLIGHFQEQLLIEDSPEWQEGLQKLCSELERTINEFYADFYQL